MVQFLCNWMKLLAATAAMAAACVAVAIIAVAVLKWLGPVAVIGVIVLVFSAMVASTL